SGAVKNLLLFFHSPLKSLINPWRDFSVGAKEMVDQSGAACDNRAAQPGGRRRRFGVYEVVVVDDEIAVADMMARHIAKLPGFHVAATFYHGLAARDFLQQNHADILLTD